jgi:hypothetical protein
MNALQPALPGQHRTCWFQLFLIAAVITCVINAVMGNYLLSQFFSGYATAPVPSVLKIILGALVGYTASLMIMSVLGSVIEWMNDHGHFQDCELADYVEKWLKAIFPGEPGSWHPDKRYYTAFGFTIALSPIGAVLVSVWIANGLTQVVTDFVVSPGTDN